MSMTPVKLGGFVKENIEAINNNFSDVQLNKADKTEIPTKVSQLENDSKYQTEAQVKALIDALVNSSPETLDTLKELADALGNDPNFATTIANQIGQKVDKVEGKQLSTEDYTFEEKTKLAGLKNYELPIGGDELGGVKNGGNVVIEADGTMNASIEGGAIVIKKPFTSADEGWASTEGNFTYTIALDGKNVMAIYRKKADADEYENCMAGLRITSTSLIIESVDKFNGYALLI